MTADKNRQDPSKEELQRQLDEVNLVIHIFVAKNLTYYLLASSVLVSMTVVTAAVGARALRRPVAAVRALLIAIIRAIARQSLLTDTMVAMGALVAARGRLVATRAPRRMQPGLHFQVSRSYPPCVATPASLAPSLSLFISQRPWTRSHVL